MVRSTPNITADYSSPPKSQRNNTPDDSYHSANKNLHLTNCFPLAVSGSKILNSDVEFNNDQKAAVQGSPVVRFASEHEEIEPEQSLDTTTDSALGTEDMDDSKVKELTQTLQSAQLAGRRMSCFAFEPVSLPASRVRFPPFFPAVASYHTRWAGCSGCPAVLENAVGN